MSIISLILNNRNQTKVIIPTSKSITILTEFSQSSTSKVIRLIHLFVYISNPFIIIMILPPRDTTRPHQPWTIFGITSFGDGCGKKNKYGIYSRLPNYIDWIWSVINCNGNCTPRKLQYMQRRKARSRSHLDVQ